MTAYATVDDFETRFGSVQSIEVTTIEYPTANTITLPRLEAALSDASSFIDGYLSHGGYITPIGDATADPPTGNIPGVVLRLTCEIAWYYLDRLNPDARERYKEAVTYLESVAKGEVDLGLPILEVDKESGSIQYYSGDRIFDQDKLRAMGYDIPRKTGNTI